MYLIVQGFQSTVKLPRLFEMVPPAHCHAFSGARTTSIKSAYTFLAQICKNYQNQCTIAKMQTSLKKNTILLILPDAHFYKPLLNIFLGFLQLFYPKNK